MLIKELIARHVGPEGSLHVRDVRVDDTQLPPGTTVHHEGDQRDGGADTVAPVAGDLVLANAPVGLGLPEHVDNDLPVGVSLMLLFEAELTELPVDRVLAALAVAKLQVVEAVVVSGVPAATVAVVATRTDELVVPEPSLAQNLERGDHTGPALLRRLLGEHVLEGLVHQARENALELQVEAVEARVVEATAELERNKVQQRAREAAFEKDLDIAHKATDAARKEAVTARKEAEAERKRMQSLRSSTSFKLASRLARMSGVARRLIPRFDPRKRR